MTDGCPKPDVEFDAARFLCCRATLDDLLSDDIMAPVLRSAGYQPDEFREMITEMARKGETRCSCD
jgi:hypothetical protein